MPCCRSLSRSMQPQHNSKHRQVVLRSQVCHHCGCTFATGSPSVAVCDFCLSQVDDSDALVAQLVERPVVNGMREGSIPSECAEKKMEPQTDNHDFLMQFFDYAHLPPHLQGVSKRFAEMADVIIALPKNPQRTTALQKLIEAKDCAVRAVIADERVKAPVSVTVNGVSFTLGNAAQSYDELCMLAGYDPFYAPTVMVVHEKQAVSIVRGESVKLDNKAHVSVIRTDNA